jgi:hypothetical protein
MDRRLCGKEASFDLSLVIMNKSSGTLINSQQKSKASEMHGCNTGDGAEATSGGMFMANTYD